MATHKQNLARWAKRRKDIVKLASRLTHKEIGDQFGMTPQRVGQIIKMESQKGKGK